MEGSLSEGSINSRFLWGGKGKQLSWGCLEQLQSCGASEADSTSLGKGNNMSFLQMLECAETRNPGCFQRLEQHEKAAAEQQIPSLELESSGEAVFMASSHSCCMNSRSEEEMKEKRKRKRGKSREEVEGQRMTHIAVERNRRRQMNDHLSTLRSLMPAASYVHRGDQASIIGGAIEFVKELEQLLQSLEAQKRMRKGDSDAAGVRLRVIERHANVKVECEWMPAGLLVKAIAELEEMRLSVLHLNITDSHSSLLCLSLNLKIEDDCKVRSADEIAGAVQHLFNSFVVTSNL